MRQLYLDMDGVLADFDEGYYRAFGYRPSKEKDDVDWARVRRLPGFYRNLPPMPDFEALFNFAARHQPIVLTGIPSSIPEAAENKRSWVRWHMGAHIRVICCRSADKCTYCLPGDVLVDDWEKHRDAWLGAEGVWITHRDADSTIAHLQELGF